MSQIAQIVLIVGMLMVIIGGGIGVYHPVPVPAASAILFFSGWVLMIVSTWAKARVTDEQSKVSR